MRNTDRARAGLVAQARLWISTPYRHQQALLGQGVDCVGLVLAAGVASGVMEPPGDDWEPYAGYSRSPNPRKMGEAMRTFLRPLELGADLPPDGSVMWMGWRDHMPMHLAILATATDGTGRRTMVHAFAHSGACVEHGFADVWPARVVSWWSYPGLT